MAIKQISAYIENKKGKMAEVIGKIANEGINIRAMSVADSGDFGILRLIVSDADKTRKIIAEDTLVKENSVVAVKMDDSKGALFGILKAFDESDINLDYSYASLSPKEYSAFAIFRVNDVDNAETILEQKGFELLKDTDI